MGTGTRERLLAAAVALLTAEGPAAVQARRLAREIDASTMAVYHHFGGMGELMAAVRDEGYRALGARLAAIAPTADPVADLSRLALVHRETAHGNRHLYDLMNGPTGSGGPVVVDSPSARAAYVPLVTGVTRAMAAGRIREDAPERVAAQFWTALHGFTTLELAGQFVDLGDPLRGVLVPLGVNLLVGLGDTRERATASVQAALAGVSAARTRAPHRT